MRGYVSFIHHLPWPLTTKEIKGKVYVINSHHTH